MLTALKAVARRAGVTRGRVAGVRMCCERHFLATAFRQRHREVGRILCYHSIGQPLWGVNDVTPARFRMHVETALEAGFRFVPASQIASGRSAPGDLAISFDDGLRSVLTHAAPILKDYNVPWSLFVVSDWCEQRHSFGDDVMLGWRDVERLMHDGVEIGSHSVTHPDFGKLDLAEVEDELGTSRIMIERRLGFAPATFAVPLGQSGNWTAACADAARTAGYDVVYAQAEETRPAATVARTFVTAFDDRRIFKALLRGAFDRWEEWV